ncbi:predicted protein [Naegleria gruberi]|uniref:Predicted protein n=1 Tax=Naegleria gruberi TaxID=5762 RepID=D2W1L6_NAEGR|nr:uncharacterized protein NAEGRDRAFT_53994 [Naegleria gruberi]EFC37112.1 predicted protein [Naegleria gruberi]|eukprot:XP_002669856.1 predicted protein [Naegleria gruberi strain NEG-M]
MKSVIIALFLGLVSLQYVLALGSGNERFAIYKTSDCSSDVIGNVTLNTKIPLLDPVCTDLSCSSLGSLTVKPSCAEKTMPAEAPTGTAMISYYGPSDATCSSSDGAKISAVFSVSDNLDSSVCIQMPTLPDALSSVASKVIFFDFRALKIYGCGNLKAYTDTACTTGEKALPDTNGLCVDGYKVKVQCNKISTNPSSSNSTTITTANNCATMKVSFFVLALVALLFFAF